MLEVLKVIILGIVQGITEWLPVSSTGHLILVGNVLKPSMSDAFMEMFDVVIQLGAIMAVVVLYFHKLNPFSPRKSHKQKMLTWQMWIKVLIASVPAGIVGVLFNDILDLSSLEADSLSFNIRPIKLIDICLQLEQQFCYKVKNGTKLILDDVDTELYVSGDWNRIIQIISNLLSNAAKFTPKGEIHFGYREKEDFVEFYVKDSGIGIPAERVATIFQRFGKINDFVQGIGLGLTLCRMLVEKMGGRIWLRSQEGKGSRFYFTLPLIRQ